MAITEEIFTEMLERIAAGEAVRQLCKEPQYPHAQAFYNYKRDTPNAEERYAQAKRSAMEMMADEILEIADKTERDFNYNPETGELVVNGEHIQRARLMVDSRKWLMAKLAPEKYGDSHTVKGDAQNPLIVQDSSPEQTARRVAAMLAIEAAKAKDGKK